MPRIDIDFTKEARYVAGYKPGDRPRAFAKKFADAVEVIPRSQWRQIVEANPRGLVQPLVTRIYDQGNEGSCVSNATGQAHEITQARQFGKDRVVHLSAMSLYKRCASGPNSGSMVDENWDELRDVGILPLNNAENKARFSHTFPATGWSNKFPSGWEQTAGQFKGVEAFIVESTDEFVSCLLKGWPVVYGRSGHCICACDYVYEGSTGLAKYANSWGDWGDAGGDFDSGFGFDSMSKIADGSDWAFAVRSVTAPLLA